MFVTNLLSCGIPTQVAMQQNQLDHAYNLACISGSQQRQLDAYQASIAFINNDSMPARAVIPPNFSLLFSEGPGGEREVGVACPDSRLRNKLCITIDYADGSKQTVLGLVDLRLAGARVALERQDPVKATVRFTDGDTKTT